MSRKISIERSTSLNGEEVHLFRLTNNIGSYIEVSNYGATLTSVIVTNILGKMTNIILSYPEVEDYFSDQFYLGSTIGRFANRIAKAQFNLDGSIYFLDKNDGINSNHGGFNGFNTKIFSYNIINNSLILSCVSKDGEGGFPGELQLTVTFSLSDNNSLNIEYEAISDKKTVFNPTCHAYFNLSGNKDNILQHQLKVFADYYLETNDEFIPTGKLIPIENTAFDFREYKTIQSMMHLKQEVLPGYNTYFISNSDTNIKHLASLYEENSEITVDMFSTMPGVQIYTGDYLSAPHYPLSGICLEAQFYPDGPNHSHFESCILDAGISKKYIISYDIHCGDNY